MTTTVKADLLQSLRKRFNEERDQLWERHRKGAGGIEIVKAYTDLVDRLIRDIYLWLAERHGDAAISRHVALVGLGGYGRGELNPHSDIDLMFLVDGRIRREHRNFVNDFLAFLWDMKFQVGHSTRQIRDCLRLLRRDVVTATALLEGRYLMGHRPTFDAFEEQVQQKYVERHRIEFVKRKLKAIDERHEEFARSQFHLEPNIKEGVGGLRDVHSSLWVERVAHGIDTLDDLRPSHIIDEYDLEAMKAAYDFLLRVRTELHLLADRKQDLLDMNYQVQVATSFGFRNTPKKAAVENFMSYYYINVGHIRHFLNVILEQEKRNPEIFNTPQPESRPEILPEPFVFIGNQVFLANDQDRYFAGELGCRTLMRIFKAVQQHGLTVSDHVCRCIRRSIPLVRLQLLYLEEIQQQFWELLGDKKRAAHTVRIMHETGFLGALMPEFEGITCLYQYDYFHQFTVDEHTLRVLEEAENINETDDPEFLAVRKANDQIERPEILRLAILLHDAGKAEGRAEHIRNGALLVARVCERMQAEPGVARSVRYLVENHLLMSQMAHRRDFSDPHVIRHFSQVVGSKEMLHNLYVLTVADIRGVSRGSWTGWKGALLEDLYYQTSDAFDRGEVDPGRSQQDIREYLLNILPDGTEPERVDSHIKKMPERYLRECSMEDIAEHIRLIDGLRGKLFNTRMVRTTSSTEFTICTGDRPGLFAEITGTLAGAGYNVWGARVYTREDGIALDVFFLLNRDGNPVPVEQLELLNQRLDEVFSGRKEVKDMIRKQETRVIPGRRSESVRPPRIQIDNETSPSHTIIDVYTHDRVVILFTVSQAISQLGLDIHLAKIDTDVDQLLDVFYVTDQQGNKVQDPQELDKIELTLMRVLEKTKPASWKSSGVVSNQ